MTEKQAVRIICLLERISEKLSVLCEPLGYQFHDDFSELTADEPTQADVDKEGSE